MFIIIHCSKKLLRSNTNYIVPVGLCDVSLFLPNLHRWPKWFGVTIPHSSRRWCSIIFRLVWKYPILLAPKTLHVPVWRRIVDDHGGLCMRKSLQELVKQTPLQPPKDFLLNQELLSLNYSAGEGIRITGNRVERRVREMGWVDDSLSFMKSWNHFIGINSNLGPSKRPPYQNMRSSWCLSACGSTVEYILTTGAVFNYKYPLPNLPPLIKCKICSILLNAQ